MPRPPNCVYKVLFARRYTQWSVFSIYTPFMNIPGQSEVQYRHFMATWINFLTQNQSDQNGINLYSYLRFCGNIMCTACPNDILWLTKATRTDKSGCDMPNDSKFALLFGQWGVLWVRMGAKWRIGDFVVMVILEIKNHSFHLPAGYPGVQ